ncbi:MAG: EamA family transporter [Candidatus Onthovivens sp.]|nr:EamA family transporter [Candidatus Onthovivens sp.]
MYIYIIFALIASIFTSLTTILAKVGIKNVNSNFATCFRTFIVIICSLILCLIQDTFKETVKFNYINIIFIILSSIATFLSWIFYYKALKIGEVSKVVAIDKCSFVLTTILFIIFFFNDTTNNGNIFTIISIVLSLSLMIAGTLLMLDLKKKKDIDIESNSEFKHKKKYIIYAILSAIFASLVSLFIKIGLNNISSSILTFYRTILVFIFALIIVIVKKDYIGISKIDAKSYIFLTLSGLSTGIAWISEYEALNIPNSNPLVVSSITKLSIILTFIVSFIFFKEKANKKTISGVILLTLGIVLIIINDIVVKYNLV